MGKQKQKDRGYLTTSEWKEVGGFKDKARVPFKRLPFHCCGILFTPFEDPVCTEDGTVFDVTAIVPYVMKYKRHPVTGQPLALKDLIHLNVHKNAEGQYDCPVTGKVFTEHTHIAAVKTTGNVYAYEALDIICNMVNPSGLALNVVDVTTLLTELDELCIKPKSWKDLLTDEPFTRKDIIHIQDPLNLSGKATDQFDHVRQGLVLDEELAAEDPTSNLRNMTEDMKRALGALQTAEAKAAFEAGGGGKRAEAIRLLAAAKALAIKKGDKGDSKVKDNKASEGAGGEGVPVASANKAGSGAGAGVGTGEGDWRLRAPDRNTDLPRFRPGAATWDTEDYTTKDGKALKKKEDALAAMVATAGVRNEAVKEAMVALAKGGKPGSTKGMTPQERYEAEGHVKYVESAVTTGQAAQSFTSTYAAVHTKANRQLMRKDRNPKKKGYVRLHTNLGDINLELHCDIVPRTCENFIALCTMGYYDNTIFHRSIKNFMIQGGDPTGTGLGGESIYGKTFKDEVDSRLTHSGRGVLSMANSGPATNGSQFFITYKSCKHLDFKHSVFGRVVGGWEVLTAMENIDTDEDDRPKQEVKVTGATVFTNPYQEMEDEEKAAEEAARAAEARKEATRTRTGEGQHGKWFSAPATALPAGASQGTGTAALEDADGRAGGGGGGVGKYLKLSTPALGAAGSNDQDSGEQLPAVKKQKTAGKPSTALSNFDAW